VLDAIGTLGSGCAVVGGAVRDAFLRRSGGDLDLTSPPGRAEEMAAALAVLLSSRPLALGRAPRRIFKVAHRRGEIDVWEREGTPEEDLLRRDFTVNALQVLLPGFVLEALPGALDDLASRRLRPPRPMVFLEDPVRVLRAARFEAELEGFRLVPTALPEVRTAAALLGATPAERRLAELDRILAVPNPAGGAAFTRLETWGVLGRLLPMTSSEERRRGLALVRRLRAPDPAVARALFLSPIDAPRAEAILEEWKVSRHERRMAVRLRSLPFVSKRRPLTRREVATFLRDADPFVAEAVSFLEAKGGPGPGPFLAALEAVAARPAALRRILSPPRPASAEEIANWLGGLSGPRLGEALATLDLALAAGEVRGRRQAREFLSALAPG
jgi:tRNA nucleotidyltransferase/poly(A) polymerase